MPGRYGGGGALSPSCWGGEDPENGERGDRDDECGFVLGGEDTVYIQCGI